MKTKEMIEADVAAEFRELHDRTAQAHPGVFDLLAVYGGYDEGVRKMNEYFAALNPRPRFSATNATS